MLVLEIVVYVITQVALLVKSIRERPFVCHVLVEAQQFTYRISVAVVVPLANFLMHHVRSGMRVELHDQLRNAAGEVFLKYLNHSLYSSSKISRF